MQFSNFGIHMTTRTFVIFFVLAVSAGSQQQASSAKAQSHSLMQLSLEQSKIQQALSRFVTSPLESTPLGIRDFMGDILAFATAVCSFAMCRLVLLPILVPEASQAAKPEGLETIAEDDEQTENDEMEKDGSEENINQLDEHKGTIALTAAPTTSCQKGMEHTVRGQVSSKAAEDSGEKSVKAGSRGPCKEEKDVFGCTALHLAAHAGNTDEVAELLDRGFNPNAQEKIGETPLHLAVRAGCTECVQALLAGGTKIDVRNMFGKTAMGVVPQDNTAMYQLLRTASK